MATPNCVDQIVVIDDAVAVIDEIFKYVKDLRFDGDEFATAAQLSPFDIKDKILEFVDQFPPRLSVLLPA